MPFDIGAVPKSDVGNPFGGEYPPEVVRALSAHNDQPMSYPIRLGEGITLTAGIRNAYLEINGLVKIIGASTFDD